MEQSRRLYRFPKRETQSIDGNGNTSDTLEVQAGPEEPLPQYSTPTPTNTTSPAAPTDAAQNVNHLNGKFIPQSNSDLHALSSQVEFCDVEVDRNPTAELPTTRGLIAPRVSHNGIGHSSGNKRFGIAKTSQCWTSAMKVRMYSDDAISNNDRKLESNESQQDVYDELTMIHELSASTEPTVIEPMSTSHDRRASEPIPTSGHAPDEQKPVKPQNNIR
ncbi:hypothetical protein QAD02_003086 [Eretmocerus hayati]|uniref:Uncharacterized protein n=1 Tax=Eretmocerus hayati TaxID=131215 RepID=A0ACC2NL59_9HYME|nr:hypothetical protein QAD02_003086 [Eretmocerus hayati]